MIRRKIYFTRICVEVSREINMWQKRLKNLYPANRLEICRLRRKRSLSYNPSAMGFDRSIASGLFQIVG